ncbi:MAG: class I SAM-dependent methyltransferase [Porticoccaceae bacterium]
MSLQEIFEDIYNKRSWGGTSGSFNSGSGSDTAPSDPYVETVRNYIRESGSTKVVDLGCGDFRVGGRIVQGLPMIYIGVDIARPLIAHLNATAAGPAVTFQCLNIVDEPLPQGDLYLVRQVLQHLSNQQITAILHKLKGASVIVTEHIPTGQHVEWNKDKVAGPDIRLFRHSGVFLERPPYSLQLETLLEVPQPFNGVEAVLRTSLIRSA